jgi:hypothetical protein
MTYLYMFSLDVYLFKKVLSRYTIECSLKKSKITFWNCHVVICLGSLSISFYYFQNWVDALLSPLDIYDVFQFGMLGDGPLEGLVGKLLDAREKCLRC